MRTPSQTVGPFFEICLTQWANGPVADPGGITIGGYVLDGNGDVVPDALIETWQAGPDGRFDHPDDPRGRVPGFRGFGRCPTEPDGSYGILTLVPGVVQGQAPHIDVSVFARGLLDRVVTRIYFPENTEANAADEVLQSVPEDRRHTLIAAVAADGYRFDVRLQGEVETVFFDV